MNENEKTIIKAMAKRLEEVRSLSGFLYFDTEEAVVAALQKEGLDIPTIQSFGYMSKALVRLADETPTAPLPATGELRQKKLALRNNWPSGSF